MAANILITGGSGYLGGSLLAEMKNLSDLPPHGTVYALVRSDEQAEKVKASYGGAVPLMLDLEDQEALTEALVARRISVVFFLIAAGQSEAQIRLIKALAHVQKTLGVQTHLVHTSGAKLFSSLTGHPTDRDFADDDDGLYELQKSSRSPYPMFEKADRTNTEVIEAAEAHGVRAYIFIPCIVYGQGTGFGNPISIQTVAIVKAAKATRRIIKVDSGRPTWPVCHIDDNTSLYIQLLRKILSGEPIGYNKQGYYLASPGSVAWEEIYGAMGAALAKRGIVDDAVVEYVDDATLEKAAQALPPALGRNSQDHLTIDMGGKCTLIPQHGKKIGWTPKYSPEHIFEAADAEVELILKHL